MKEYHKINTLFQRDDKTKRIIEGVWAIPEFGYLAENDWIWTEKVDGTNIRVMWDGSTVTYGGKTDNAQIPVKLLYTLQAHFDGTENRRRMLEVFSTEGGVCLYGEGYGAGIQKVGAQYKADGTAFVLFDIRVGEWWLERSDIVNVATELGVPYVPAVGRGTLTDAIRHVKQGMVSTWGNFTAEGLVLRPTVSLRTRRGDRIIGKIKFRDFK